jgi:Retrotransposon gag protein
MTAMKTTTTPEAQETESLNKLRSQISTDIEAMQQKESSLREYEQRLRTLVEQAQHHPQRAPAAAPASPAAQSKEELDAEWEKYQRAHALLEAARRGLCDDRMALKDKEEKFAQREVEVARREAWIKVREQELEAQAEMRAKELDTLKEKPKPKQRSTFSVAPLVAARKLLMRHT